MVCLGLFRTWRSMRVRHCPFGIGIVSAALLMCSGLGCQPDQAPPKKEAVAKAPSLCSGHSVDPPRSALQPGISALAEREYEQAQRVFEGASRSHPGCASCRVWMADSILFDRGKDELAAAKESSPWYNEAQELHDAGCRLPRRQRYYLLMGQAYGALRLARTEAGYDASELRKAETPLTVASQEFPSSAEIPYTLARAYCALAQSSPGVDAKKGDPSEGDEKGEVPEARIEPECWHSFPRLHAGGDRADVHDAALRQIH